MHRRKFLKSSLLTISSLFLNSTISRISQNQPNLIFILADDLGIGDLHCFGGLGIETPYLDKLAKEGMRFTRFYAAAAVCSPTRASCLTGRYPLRFNIIHHFDDRDMFLPAGISTLPRLLKSAGYKTQHVGKWHLGGLNVKHCGRREKNTPGPLEHGFDHYLCMYEDPEIRPRLLKERRLYRDGGKYLVEDDKPCQPIDQHWTDIKIETSLKFIEKCANSGEHFFLNLWFDVPHTPYEPAPSQFVVPYIGRAFGDDKLYRSMVAHLDNGINRIVEKLEKCGIDDNTLIIFTSDNGPAFYGSPGPFKGRKGDLHEGGINVPMIARWPGHIPADTASDQISITNDILPTLCAVAHIDIPKDVLIDGVNLYPILSGQSIELKPRTLFWKLQPYDYFYSETTDLKPKPIATEAVRHGKWKLLCKDTQPIELYNLEEDPYERWNLVDWQKDIVRQLKDELLRWLSEPRLQCCPKKER